jgi:hypothetical protein
MLTIDGEPIWYTPHTMRTAYGEIAGDEPEEYPWVPLGNFSNDFFGEPELREHLIKDPIIEPDNATAEAHQWAVFCAASVEYLCQKYDLMCPQWVHDPQFSRIENPWYMTFSLPGEHTKQYLRETTHELFARRNIFCGDRVWMSKREVAAAARARRQERNKQPV